MQRYTKAPVALMTAQALFGTLWPTAYRDPDWKKRPGLGTTASRCSLPHRSCGSPVERRHAGPFAVNSRGSVSLDTRCITTPSTLFGAALNAFLPLYVITLGVAIVTLASGLVRIDPMAI